MRVIALSVAVSLAVWGSAFAAERAAPKDPAPHCETIEAMRAAAKGAKLTLLTPGQFHFAEGIYVGSPLTPHGLPPGDGALLIEYGNGKGGVIWTRGKQACITIFVTDAEHHQATYMPMPVDLKMVEAIKTGVAEIAPSSDDSGDVHL